MTRLARRTFSYSSKVVAVVVAVSLMSACGSSAKKATLTVTLGEFSLKLDHASVGAGAVRIDVHDGGAAEHELVVMRSDLDEAHLPLIADGTRIDEEGTGVTHLDPEAEGIKPGTTKTVTVELTPGRYVLVCNLPAHYTQGMHAVLTVT